MTKQELENQNKELLDIIDMLIEEREDYNYLKFCLMMDDYDCFKDKIAKGE